MDDTRRSNEANEAVPVEDVLDVEVQGEVDDHDGRHTRRRLESAGGRGTMGRAICERLSGLRKIAVTVTHDRLTRGCALRVRAWQGRRRDCNRAA